MTSNDQRSEMMRAGDVARIFGVDRKTVTRWTKVGLLTFIRTPGGHRRYRAADVAALKDSAGVRLWPDRNRRR